MTPREHAEQLLEEWHLCQHARPKNNAVDIQLDKDSLTSWISYLARQLTWGSDVDLREACYQVESRLKNLKEKLVIEVLKNGSV